MDYPDRLEDTDDFYDAVTRYLPDEDNALVATDLTEGGFVIKEKHFKIDYKGHVLFRVENQTEKSYSLTVHAVYYDHDGKKKDELWNVYSDIGAGNTQYLILDPDFGYKDCEYDFSVKESDNYIWRNDVHVTGGELERGRSARKETIFAKINVKNDSDKVCRVVLQGVYLFDAEGNIISGQPTRAFDSLHPGQESYLSIWIAESADNEKVVLPTELEDGFYMIPVVSGITERTSEE